MDFDVPVEHKIKINENEKRDKNLELKELRKLWNLRVTVLPIVLERLERSLTIWKKRLKEFEIGGRIESIQVEISQNTEKNLGYLKGLAVTQTPVKDHH